VVIPRSTSARIQSGALQVRWTAAL